VRLAAMKKMADRNSINLLLFTLAHLSSDNSATHLTWLFLAEYKDGR
jgi:hypothetical protein